MASSDAEDSSEDDEEGNMATPSRLTSRQAVLLSSSARASTDELPASTTAAAGASGRGGKKAPLNEQELQLRRAESARKRKNLTEKKLQDEKVCSPLCSYMSFRLMAYEYRRKRSIGC